MKIPYGIANFKSLREEGCLYVDKTKHIEMLENYGNKYIFFIRPRRFGKSLFLSTLGQYYDINAVGEFNKLFGDLYIGQNPTPLKNSYLILPLNFSGLNTASKDKLEDSFRLRLVDAIDGFLSTYKKFFEDIPALKNRLRNTNDISAVFNLLIQATKNSDKKIYLIIDEYDHFANDIIAMGDGPFYKEIIRATGFVRDFYETLKIGTETVIDRIFITGISPVMLDDLTSGFNIAGNLTMKTGLNEMLGFTEDEVTGIIDKLNINVTMPDNPSLLTRERLRDELKKNYNGYLFNEEAQQRIYNPSMILYFLNECRQASSGKYPKNIIDDNIKTDYGRLNRLTANEANKKLLDKIIKNEGITANIATRFSFDNMNDLDYFVSLLFYMGLLTISRQERTRLLLEIPNYVIKTVFWEYMMIKLKKEHNIRIETEGIRRAIEKMAYDGEIEPYINYISENIFKKLSNRDLINFDEKNIKIMLFIYLADSNAYRPQSEKETEAGYIDIYLEKDPRIPDIKYEWLIELKYLKESERNNLEQAKQKGLQQLQKYATSKNLTSKQDLKKALVIFIGKKDYVLVNETGQMI